MRTYIVLFALLVLLAFFARMSFFGAYFSGDAMDAVAPARNYVEIGRAAVYATSDKSAESIAYIDDGLYFNFAHPPMRVAVYSLWASLVGFSNETIILLPIIFGLLTVFLIFLIARDLYSENVALIALFFAAVIRYHFYSSLIAFGDNFVMFAGAAAVYFFLRYMKKNNHLYTVLTTVFVALAFLAKLSSITLLPVLFAVAVLSGKNKPRYLLLVVAIGLVSVGAVYFSSGIAEYFTGVSSQDKDFFGTYMGAFFSAGDSIHGIVEDKTFYLLSFAWQFTPFFGALTLLAVLKLKRDRSYWILAAWFFITFLIGFSSRGQDFQRLMIIGIAPITILAAKYVSDIDLSRIHMGLIGFILPVLLAFLVKLDDTMSYYSPQTILLFFILAAALLLHPERRWLLTGAAVGLSVFFLFGTSFGLAISSSSVAQVVGEADARNYPYYELWSSRDITMYLAEPGKPSFLRLIRTLDTDFVKENNIRYYAFYAVYEEGKILNLSTLCEDTPFFAVVNGRKTGLVCKMKQF